MYMLPSSGSEMLRSFNVNTGRNTTMAFQGNIAHQSKGGPEGLNFTLKVRLQLTQLWSSSSDDGVKKLANSLT